jgi:hypothetical protein
VAHEPSVARKAPGKGGFPSVLQKGFCVLGQRAGWWVPRPRQSVLASRRALELRIQVWSEIRPRRDIVRRFVVLERAGMHGAIDTSKVGNAEEFRVLIRAMASCRKPGACYRDKKSSCRAELAATNHIHAPVQ